MSNKKCTAYNDIDYIYEKYICLKFLFRNQKIKIGRMTSHPTLYFQFLFLFWQKQSCHMGSVLFLATAVDDVIRGCYCSGYF